jgi:hypothetical protein
MLFTIMALAFLLAIAGLAIDLTYFSVVQGELQRSMDAAALAGAGMLGFGDYTLPGHADSVVTETRKQAQDYANRNDYRGGTIAPSDPNLIVKLGTFKSGKFTEATLPGDDVLALNAVSCSYSSSIPASFLRILGFDQLGVAAAATAVSSPPLKPETGTCIFPVGVSKCAFQQDPADPSKGFDSSRGCGSLVTFLASGNVNVAPTPRLTSAWINLAGTTPPTSTNANNDVINAVPGRSCAFNLTVGSSVGVIFGGSLAFGGPTTTVKNNYNAFAAAGTQVTGASGVSTLTGLRVVVPVLDTPCPEPLWTQTTTQNYTYTIVGWTRLVIKGGEYQGVFTPPTGFGSAPAGYVQSGVGGHNTIFAYIDCTRLDADYNANTAPISARSRRLHLVQPVP